MTIEELAENTIEEFEASTGIFVKREREAIKESLILLMKKVRKATIEETIDVCSWNIDYGYMGASIRSDEVRKELDLNSIQE